MLPYHAGGTVSIPDTISRQQGQALARRTITPSDLKKWPGLTFDGAGKLGAKRAFIGPTEAESLPLKLPHLVFGNGSHVLPEDAAFATSPDGSLLAASFATLITVVHRHCHIIELHNRRQRCPSTLKPTRFRWPRPPAHRPPSIDRREQPPNSAPKRNFYLPS